MALWEAAGRPGDLEHVCPQRFAAPLAPHLAARAEGREIDAGLLRTGLDYWRSRSRDRAGRGGRRADVAAGRREYVADLAWDFGFPLIVVTRNILGTINATLQTLIAASVYRGGLEIAGVVLNHPAPPSADDISLASNRRRTCRPLHRAAIGFYRVRGERVRSRGGLVETGKTEVFP